jgi:hypothetical protein
VERGELDEEWPEEWSEEEVDDDDDGSSYTESPELAATAAPTQPERKTTGEAASQSHIIGPITRCDLDSLSVVLSMLSSDDFLSAIRVNKQFYAARLKKTAWPALQLDSFIQSLRDDDYDNPARRRLRIRCPNHLSADASARVLNASSVLGSVAPTMWRFVTDVKLYCPFGNEWVVDPSVNFLVRQLVRLPCLTAINFHLVNVSAAAFQQFCTAVAPRLQVLLFSCARMEGKVDPLTHVSLLHQLRVLVVDKLPPMQALLQLHQLEYLHIEEPPAYDAVCFALVVRHLSSSHALRSLSLGETFYALPHGLLSTEQPSQLSAAYTALVDWTRPIHLTDLSCAAFTNDEVLQSCSAIPTLTRVQACTHIPPWVFSVDPQPLLTGLARPQQLRLDIYNSDKVLRHLAQCNKLRVLQLRFRTSSTTGTITADSLCAIVAANAATLEELCFSRDMDTPSDETSFASFPSKHGCPLALALEDGAAGAEKWSVLVQCARLRLLEVPLDTTLTPHLLNALANASAFQSLDLVLPSWMCRSSHRTQLSLVSAALSAVSWCSVRLLNAIGTMGLRSADELAKMLPPPPLEQLAQPAEQLAAALRRLRVFVQRAATPTERCFVLRNTNDGDARLQWQLEY